MKSHEKPIQQCGETLHSEGQFECELVPFCLWRLWFLCSLLSFVTFGAYLSVRKIVILFWVLACGGTQVKQCIKQSGLNRQSLLSKCGMGLVLRHRMALILLCLIHGGEAHNPGPCNVQPPVWTLGTFNPSGLNGKQQVLSEHLSYGDLWAVTETHLSSRAMHTFRGGLKSSHSPFSYCVGGHPAPPRPQSDHSGAWTGVAMVSKHPTRPVPVVWKHDVYQTSRVQVTATLCNDLWITGGVVYGEPPGISHPFAKEHNETLLRDVIEAVVSVRGLRFIAGDWNFQLDQLEAFTLLRRHGFQDIQTIAEEKWGRTPMPTCKRVTRKDFMFISPELRDLLIDVKIEDDVWADHSVIAGVFQGGPQQVVRHSWRMPTSYPWPSNFEASSFAPCVDFKKGDPTSEYASLWSQTEQAASMTRCATTSLHQEHANKQAEVSAIPRSALGRGQTLQTVLKLHHRRPQTVAQIAYEILETSPEHGHTRPAGKQDGTKDRREKLGWETSQEGKHSIPDKLGDKTRDKKKTSPGGADTASQMKDKLRDKTKTKAGRQDQRQEKDKTREADRASQTRWETRPETAQRGGHSADKTADKRKTRPARRTQHPRPDGRQAGRQDRRQPSEADTASQPRWQTRPETRPQTRERQGQ